MSLIFFKYCNSKV